MKNTLSIVVLSASVALLAGCASSGYKKADQASTSLQQAAQGLDNSLIPFDAALVALSDLVNNPGPNMAPQFRKYSSAVSALETQANITKGHATAMEEEGVAYFRNWNEELARIQNDSIRTRSLDRKIVVAAQFEEARASYVQTTAGFDPFLADLQDIRTVLATDLTSGGLNSVESLVRKSNTNSVPVRESLVTLSKELKRLGASLSVQSPTP